MKTENKNNEIAEMPLYDKNHTTKQRLDDVFIRLICKKFNYNSSAIIFCLKEIFEGKFIYNYYKKKYCYKKVIEDIINHKTKTKCKQKLKMN